MACLSLGLEKKSDFGSFLAISWAAYKHRRTDVGSLFTTEMFLRTLNSFFTVFHTRDLTIISLIKIGFYFISASIPVHNLGNSLLFRN